MPAVTPWPLTKQWFSDPESIVPMSTKERASIAGRARADSQTREQRQALARKAYLTGAVNAVVNRAPELTPDQCSKLRAIFGGTAR